MSTYCKQRLYIIKRFIFLGAEQPLVNQMYVALTNYIFPLCHHYLSYVWKRQKCFRKIHSISNYMGASVDNIDSRYRSVLPNMLWHFFMTITILYISAIVSYHQVAFVHTNPVATAHFLHFYIFINLATHLSSPLSNCPLPYLVQQNSQVLSRYLIQYVININK